MNAPRGVLRRLRPLGAGALSLALPAMAAAAVFGNLPDVVVCSVDDPATDALPWDRVVFYVSVRLEGGALLYKSLTSNPLLLTIDTQGRVQADNLADCDGLGADELRRRGQAFDFR